MKNGFICKTASCKLCGEYSRKRGCISKHCPYLAERVAAGALNYKGAVMEAFGSNPLFRDDLTAISRRLSESVWNGAGISSAWMRCGYTPAGTRAFIPMNTLLPCIC